MSEITDTVPTKNRPLKEWWSNRPYFNKSKLTEEELEIRKKGRREGGFIVVVAGALAYGALGLLRTAHSDEDEELELVEDHYAEPEEPDSEEEQEEETEQDPS